MEVIIRFLCTAGVGSHVPEGCRCQDVEIVDIELEGILFLQFRGKRFLKRLVFKVQ